jgi:hypothetical protein
MFLWQISFMFDPKKYGSEIAEILAMDGDGERLTPLVHGPCRSDEAKRKLKESRIHEPLLTGLYVYFGCWAEAHESAQEIENTAGIYWHAIVHRQEPDPGNAAYWYGQVGRHAIFPALRERAVEIGMPVGLEWDAKAFIEYCGNARAGSDEERKAMEVQRAEWQLLFDWCWREGR